MQWSERGVILGVRKHGESSVIVELMTRAHGRHAGVVRSGRSKTMQPVLQPGNEVLVTWRARLEEHLGVFSAEPLTLRTHLLMSDARALHGVNWLRRCCACSRNAIPMRKFSTWRRRCSAI